MGGGTGVNFCRDECYRVSAIKEMYPHLFIIAKIKVLLYILFWTYWRMRGLVLGILICLCFQWMGVRLVYILFWFRCSNFGVISHLYPQNSLCQQYITDSLWYYIIISLESSNSQIHLIIYILLSYIIPYYITMILGREVLVLHRNLTRQTYTIMWFEMIHEICFTIKNIL